MRVYTFVCICVCVCVCMCISLYVCAFQTSPKRTTHHVTGDKHKRPNKMPSSRHIYWDVRARSLERVSSIYLIAASPRIPVYVRELGILWWNDSISQKRLSQETHMKCRVRGTYPSMHGETASRRDVRCEICHGRLAYVKSDWNHGVERCEICHGRPVYVNRDVHSWVERCEIYHPVK